MSHTGNKWLTWIAVAGAVLIAALLLSYNKFAPGKLDAFASCLEEKNALFY